VTLAAHRIHNVRLLKHFVECSQGQDMVEYTLILAFVALAGAAAPIPKSAATNVSQLLNRGVVTMVYEGETVTHSRLAAKVYDFRRLAEYAGAQTSSSAKAVGRNRDREITKLSSRDLTIT